MERRNGLQHLLSLKTVGMSVVFLKYDKRIVLHNCEVRFCFHRVSHFGLYSLRIPVANEIIRMQRKETMLKK